jgi:lipopolysaccharide/colanic/teichoic acid biosynthesis glycosyltransferase
LQSGGNNSVALTTTSAASLTGTTAASLAAEPPIALASSVSSRLSLGERIFDVAITIVLLPVILIAGAMIAVAIYVDSPGPVTYRSRRIGRDGEPFEMLKFRKMRREAESHPVTLDDDARFTPIGRFLAATRLDELPQVWNVLRGEMRLVGPRPELECFVAEYPGEYRQILTVAPGITGNAQLMFLHERHLLHGPDPAAKYSTHVLPAKIDVDLDYVASRSLLGDLMILARTVLLPLTLLVDHARTPGSTMRRWIPAAASSAVLGLLFVVISGHLP